MSAAPAPGLPGADGPAVVPARETGADLLELLVGLRKALKERGESLPVTWPEEALGQLRAGSMLGWVLQRPSGRTGIAILATKAQRGFGQLHLVAGSSDGELADDLRALLGALFEGRGAGLRRLDVAVTAEPRASEETVYQALTGPATSPPFSVLPRRAMVRRLEAQSPPPIDALPDGFRFAPALAIGPEVLAKVDFAAFQGGPDEGFVADSVEGNERLLQGLLDGDLGDPLREASPAVLQEEGSGGSTTAHLVGFVLCLQESSRSALLADLAVHPGARRRGIGRALLTRALRGLIALGFHEVRLWVTDANRPALDLYTRAGFVLERKGCILQWRAP